MTKKHMEAAAEMVRTMKGRSEHERCLVADKFATLFQQFNPKFDRPRFYVACGVVG